MLDVGPFAGTDASWSQVDSWMFARHGSVQGFHRRARLLPREPPGPVWPGSSLSLIG